MNKLFNLLLAVFIGIFVSSIISTLISFNIWLDMRIHLRYVYYISIALALCLYKMGKIINARSFLIFEFISILILVFFDKYIRIIYELRESFGMRININVFSHIYVLSLIFVNLILFLKLIFKKEKKSEN